MQFAESLTVMMILRSFLCEYSKRIPKVMKLLMSIFMIKIISFMNIRKECLSNIVAIQNLHLKNDEGKDASSLKNQVAFEGTKVTVNYEQINMAQRVFKNMDYNFSVISNSDGTKTGSALFLENITQR